MKDQKDRNGMKSVRSRALAWAAGLLFAGLLGGCGTPPADSSSTASSANFPVLVNGIKLEKAPSRVAVFSPSLAEIIADMGYADILCGRSDECDYPEEVAALNAAGSLYEPDITVIRRWKPDAVLFDSSPSSEISSALFDAGLTAIVVPPAESFDQLKTVYRTIGRIFAGEYEGQVEGDALYNTLENRLDALEAAVKDAAGDTPPQALIITDSFGHAVTGATVPHRLFDAAGAVNAAVTGADWTATSEQLLAAEAIFCPEGMTARIRELSVLKDSPAVKNGRIYEVNIRTVERQGLRLAEAAEAMARALYPAAFESAGTAPESTGA